MKLILVSIIIDGVSYAKFVNTSDGKIDLYKVFPILNTLPHGKTFTVG